MKKNSILKIVSSVIMIALLTIMGVNSTALAEDTTAQNTNENIAIQGPSTEPTINEPIVVNPVKKDFTSLKITVDLSTCSYNGKEKKPYVRVYDAGKKLKLDTDYTVKYSKNIKPGKAKITISGIGNYWGTVRKYFKIAPEKAKIKKVTFNDYYTRATITWKKVKYSDGYRIYMSNKKNGTYKYIKTINGGSNLSYTKNGLDPAKEYYFKIRAFKIIDGKKTLKDYSDPKTSGRLLSSVTLTAHGSGSNRNYNLARASDTITGLVLKPGETFNWFKVVGPASKARGYKEASVFKAGKVAKGYGGGVCQVSSTLYQASVKAGLKIVERHIHSRPVTYIQLGKDATVSYGVQNLRIQNNKDYSIKIVTSAKGQSTTCKIYSLAD